jgi:hypothetical protein
VVASNRGTLSSGPQLTDSDLRYGQETGRRGRAARTSISITDESTDSAHAPCPRVCIPVQTSLLVSIAAGAPARQRQGSSDAKLRRRLPGHHRAPRRSSANDRAVSRYEGVGVEGALPVAENTSVTMSRRGVKCLLLWWEVWSGWRDSNPRPPDPQSGALPGCATSRVRRSLCLPRFATAWPTTCPGRRHRPCSAQIAATAIGQRSDARARPRLRCRAVSVLDRLLARRSCTTAATAREHRGFRLRERHVKSRGSALRRRRPHPTFLAAMQSTLE